MECFFNSRDIFIRNVLTLSLINKLTWKIWLLTLFLDDWLKVSNNSSVLTCSSRLFLMKEVELCFVAYCLSVVDSGVADLKINIIFSSHSLTIDEQVKLTHAWDNDFLTFKILLYYECGVLSLESVEGLQEDLKLVCFLRLYSDWHHRFGYMHLLHGQIHRLIAECFTACAINTEYSENISCACLINILHVVWVHADHSADLDLLLCWCIIDSCALLQFSLIDSHIGQLAELALFKLECEAYEWLFIVDFSLYLLVVLW